MHSLPIPSVKYTQHTLSVFSIVSWKSDSHFFFAARVLSLSFCFEYELLAWASEECVRTRTTFFFFLWAYFLSSAGGRVWVTTFVQFSFVCARFFSSFGFTCCYCCCCLVDCCWQIENISEDNSSNRWNSFQATATKGRLNRGFTYFFIFFHLT